MLSMKFHYKPLLNTRNRNSNALWRSFCIEAHTCKAIQDYLYRAEWSNDLPTMLINRKCQIFHLVSILFCAFFYNDMMLIEFKSIHTPKFIQTKFLQYFYLFAAKITLFQTIFFVKFGILSIILKFLHFFSNKRKKNIFIFKM